MICPTCAEAAKRQAPRTAHCNDAGCTCGHRVERYGTVTAGQSSTPATPVLRG